MSNIRDRLKKRYRVGFRSAMNFPALMKRMINLWDMRNKGKYPSLSFEFPSDEHMSCVNKVKYGHKETAAKRMMEKGSKDLEAYKCRYCDGWHIGGVL